MNLSLLKNPYVIAAAAVAVLGAAFYSMSQDASKAADVQKQLQTHINSTSTASAGQMAEIVKLTAAVNNEATSEYKRIAALEKLQQIAPDYFSNLDIETAKMGGLTNAVNSYKQSLIEAAKSKAIQKQLEDIESQLITVASGGDIADTNWMGSAISYLSEGQEGLDKLQKRVNNNMARALKDQRALLLEQTIIKEDITGETEEEGEAAEDAAEKAKAAAEKAAADALLLGEARKKALAETIAAAKEAATVMTNLEMTMQSISGVKLAPDFSTPTDGKFEAIGSGANEEFDEYNMTGGASDEEFTAINEGLDSVASKLERNSQLAGAFGGAMGASLGSIISGGQAADQALKNMGMSMLRTLLGIAKAHVVAAMSAPSTDVVATGGATIPFKIAAGFGLVEGLLGAIAFADGGIVSGPTLGLVGEYSGAKNNPEVITPLDKLKGMIQETNTGGGGGVMTARIKGSDLVLVSERGAKDLNRKRG